MPSWNIHIAEAEKLLARDGFVAALVRDRNAFLFGSVVPDVPVGYMVPDIADPIPYRITHFAESEPIPKPRAHEFWDGYVVPLLHHAGCGSCVETTTIAQERERVNRVHYPHRYDGVPDLPAVSPAEFSTQPDDVEQSLFDLTLGTWVHLLADNIWNTRVNEYLAVRGGKPSEEFRIKKQGDFDWFGKTLRLESIVRATPRLKAAAALFAQHSISSDDVLKTVGVIHEVVRENPGRAEHPPYRLLTEMFFSETFSEVLDTTERLVAEARQKMSC